MPRCRTNKESNEDVNNAIVVKLCKGKLVIVQGPSLDSLPNYITGPFAPESPFAPYPGRRIDIDIDINKRLHRSSPLRIVSSPSRAILVSTVRVLLGLGRLVQPS